MKITNEQNDIERVLFTEKALAARVEALGDEITREYKGKTPIVVCILKGASFFYTDLCRAIHTDIYMDFISVSSYGIESQSSGIVRLIKDLNVNIMGRDVILVEDIIDSGLTLNYLKGMLSQRGAASIRIVTLLDKPARRRVKDLKVDYSCFNIPDEFVVGYGLDYDQLYRNLPDIGVLSPRVYEK